MIPTDAEGTVTVQPTVTLAEALRIVAEAVKRENDKLDPNRDGSLFLKIDMTKIVIYECGRSHEFADAADAAIFFQPSPAAWKHTRPALAAANPEPCSDRCDLASRCEELQKELDKLNATIAAQRAELLALKGIQRPGDEHPEDFQPAKCEAFERFNNERRESFSGSTSILVLIDAVDELVRREQERASGKAHE